MRLADRVFAPHYAAPMARIVNSPVPLLAEPRADSEVRAELHSGDLFEVLELAGDRAWGVAPGLKLVGYIPAAALDRPGA